MLKLGLQRCCDICVVGVLLPLCLSGCSALLPKSEVVVEGPWQSFAEAQQFFDGITPQVTTQAMLKERGLDLQQHPNVTRLNYADISRRFLPGALPGVIDLDPGVAECLAAKTACQGYEIDRRDVKRHRYGGFLADFLNFRRQTDIVGWRFSAILLLKEQTVIYKLSGGQASIHEREEVRNPLGPLQGVGESRSWPR